MKVKCCLHCQKLFKAKRDSAKFCSAKHRVAYSRYQKYDFPDDVDYIGQDLAVLYDAYPMVKKHLAELEHYAGKSAVNDALAAIRAIFVAESRE